MACLLKYQLDKYRTDILVSNRSLPNKKGFKKIATMNLSNNS